ncbi:MAG TPA: caspase family protein [Dehalococcoidia bacterium]|nr:caspase family protein [Dehalococcoidia bacterium]
MWKVLVIGIMLVFLLALAGTSAATTQPMGGAFETTPKDLPVMKLPDDMSGGPTTPTGNPYGVPPGQDKKPKPDDGSEANKWAVVIGISNYRAGDSLWNPANDAKEMKQALIDNYGFPENNIKLLLDRKATARAIDKAIDWLAKSEDADSSVVFFFSGHGYRAADADKWDSDDEVDGYDELIVTYDNYGLPDGWLKGKLSTLESLKITLAFGSCHSGGMFDDPDDLQGEGRVIAAACKADEYGWDYLQLRNTLWGYYFVDEGLLQGLADLNGDGVSIQEAHAYAYAGVTSVRDDSHPQISDQYFDELIP